MFGCACVCVSVYGYTGRWMQLPACTMMTLRGFSSLPTANTHSYNHRPEHRTHTGPPLLPPPLHPPQPRSLPEAARGVLRLRFPPSPAWHQGKLVVVPPPFPPSLQPPSLSLSKVCEDAINPNHRPPQLFLPPSLPSLPFPHSPFLRPHSPSWTSAISPPPCCRRRATSPLLLSRRRSTTRCSGPLT